MQTLNPKFTRRFGDLSDIHLLEELLIKVKDHLQKSNRPWSYPFDSKDFDIGEFLEWYIDDIVNSQDLETKFALIFDEQGNIKCFQSAGFWKNIKSWRQGLIVVEPNQNYFNCIENGIGDANTMIVEHAESIGYYSYDFIVANPKNNLRWNRMREQIPVLKDRYDFFDAAIIPAGTLPTFSRYRSLMRNRSWDVDLMYRVGYLKNQFRDKDKLKISN